MTKEIFCLLLRQGQNQDKKLEVQLFLVRLLVSLALASQLRFCLVLEAPGLSLTIGLAISKVKSIGGEIAVSLLEWSWWKVVTSL